jgi:hypothetical protein
MGDGWRGCSSWTTRHRRRPSRCATMWTTFLVPDRAAAQSALFGDRGGGADCRADSGRPVFFGWLPALVWILDRFHSDRRSSRLWSALGRINSASKQHPSSKLFRIHISGRAYLLFLAFVWLALVYIVVAFTDVTATHVCRRTRRGARNAVQVDGCCQRC